MEKQSLKKTEEVIHCPVSGCLYFNGSERHFTKKKFLNQHIAKVHAEKKYSCGKCQKSFGLDWWRKHHEQTCGMKWKCFCGVKYTSRESLLTHARRTQHKLPDSVLHTDKARQTKVSKDTNQTPVILVIQPIVQQITCIQPVLNAVTTTSTDWPKPIQPRLLPLPQSPVSITNVDHSCNTAYASPSIQNSIADNFFFNLNSNSCTELSNHLVSSVTQSNDVITSNNHASSQKTASTQTNLELDSIPTLRESRASQCTRKNAKRSHVGIESTYTQTAESAVVKLKKRRSRRKSVALTTKSSMLSNTDLSMGKSLWPDFKDLILPNSNGWKHPSYKNTTSTQTSSCKVLCDSQTITDDELFNFVLDEALKEKDTSGCCNSLFEMLPDDHMTESLGPNNLPMLDMFSSTNPMSDVILTPSTTYTDSTVVSDPSVALSSLTDKKLEPCPMFGVFEDCPKAVVSNKPVPTVSDTHTQTLASTIMHYNLLANNETQTTDDFCMYDLEFLDTETQTPWEDFPNIEDSPLPVDQLSIEIQTDFSLNTSMDQDDPYGLISYGLDVPSMMNECTSTESLGVNTETQTQDKFTFPEFTNSESQTLDLSQFMFSSES